MPPEQIKCAKAAEIPAAGGNQLSTFNGCFVPCLLTILGAVLFLRLGFAVGMMGLTEAMTMLIIAEIMSCVTVTSFSALTSNGHMKGGGAYYVISRSLGPAFGGAAGVLFWVSYSINATFNVVAVTDVLQSSFIPASSWWSSQWGSVSISSIMMVPLTLIAYKGAGAFAKINAVVFLGLALACLVTAGSLFFGDQEVTFDANPSRTRSRFSLDILANNMWAEPVSSPQCESAGAFGMNKSPDQVCTTQLIFSVIFPAVVGMMEGLNLSGDLKEPGRSIPLGTFWAIAVAFVVYAALMIGQAGTMSREALQYNMDVLQKSTPCGGSFVVLGVITACLSTVLGSLFGAARVLQAMARDDVFPGLAKLGLGNGTVDGDEPRPAIIVSYMLAQAGLFLGNLDDLAPLLTNFFLLTYALTDFTCFTLEVSGVPNFRPTFQIYSWQTSLANSVLTVCVMFYLNTIYAGVTLLAAVVILLLLMGRFKDREEWMDVSQALFFRSARHSLLAMQLQRRDTKYWRPSFLLLVPSTTNIHTPGFLPLLVLLNKLKQSGLLVLGRAQICNAPARLRLETEDDNLNNGSDTSIETWTTSCSSQEQYETEVLQKELCTALPNFKGFQQVSLAPSGRLACYNLVIGAGLGPLLPDTVVLPLPSLGSQETVEGSQTGPLDAPTVGAEEFLHVLRDAARLRKNVLIAANFHKLPNCTTLNASRIDMWVLQDLQEPPMPTCASMLECKSSSTYMDLVKQMSLLLQLGHLCVHRRSSGQVAGRLRLLQALPSGAALQGSSSERDLNDVGKRWLQWARIRWATAETVSVPNALVDPTSATSTKEDSVLTVTQTRTLLTSFSHDADVVFTFLPPPPSQGAEGAALDYLTSLRLLTSGMPPFVLVANGQGVPVISTNV